MSLLPFCLQGRASESLAPEPRRANPAVAERASESSAPEPRRANPAVAARAAVGATYRLPTSALDAAELEAVKAELTMTPIETYNEAVSFDAYACDDEWLEVPRFYGWARWGEAAATALDDGAPLRLDFAGTLNPVQREATAATLARLRQPPYGTFLVLPCGYGKTVCALYLAQQLGRRTLVLVHKSFLVQQWHERARAFLPGVTVGRIQQDTADGEADVVVGMIQSLAKRLYPPELLGLFGTVIVDEAHHMSAPVFSRALRRLRCRHVLGLSATPERKDGLTVLLHHLMGPVAFRVERAPEHTLVSTILYEGGARRELKLRDGRVAMAAMLTALATDPQRNALIVAHVRRHLRADRYVIVLSDRIRQLHELHALLADAPVGFYIGSTPPSERARALEHRVLLSTYSMAKEGLDLPRLDTLVLATPKGDVVQATGRVQRKHPDKRVPLVVDVADTFSVFEGLRWKRHAFYRKEGFQCQTFASTESDAPWFA